jgi:hypothetical protein
MLAAFANLLYIYAGLPETVVVREGTESWSVGKEPLFYGAMTFIAGLNLLVYLFNKNLAPDEAFRTWLHGLIITLNIFCIIGLSFIGLYNSLENFDYSRIGVIIYSSVGLVALWAISWPIILLVRKLLSKQLV